MLCLPCLGVNDGEQQDAAERAEAQLTCTQSAAAEGNLLHLSALVSPLTLCSDDKLKDRTA